MLTMGPFFFSFPFLNWKIIPLLRRHRASREKVKCCAEQSPVHFHLLSSCTIEGNRINFVDKITFKGNVSLRRGLTQTHEEHAELYIDSNMSSGSNPEPWSWATIPHYCMPHTLHLTPHEETNKQTHT